MIILDFDNIFMMIVFKLSSLCISIATKQITAVKI